MIIELLRYESGDAFLKDAKTDIIAGCEKHFKYIC